MPSSPLPNGLTGGTGLFFLTWGDDARQKSGTSRLLTPVGYGSLFSFLLISFILLNGWARKAEGGEGENRYD